MMKTMTLVAAFALAVGAGYALAPTPAQAAHAGAPYTNVDHSNDMGNDTGDSQVDKLNSGQLDETYHGPMQLRAPAVGEPAAMAAPADQAPPR